MVIDRADHPIQETAREPRPGAAGRHLRRHLRLRRPALRQGADDPRLRPAAGRRHRRDLPLQHHPARSPPSASASTSRPPRARTSARATSAASSCGSATLPGVGRVPSSSSASLADLRRRHRRRGQARPPDRPDPVGQPGLARPIQDIDTLEERDGLAPASSGIFVTVRRRRSPTRPSTFARRLRRRAARAEYPDDAAHRVEHRHHRSASCIDIPGASDVAADRRGGRGRLRRRARRHPERRPSAADGQRAQPRSSAPARARSRSGP